MDFSMMDDVQLASIVDEVRREQKLRAGAMRVCASCRGQFAANAKAKFCSTRCRVAAHRERIASMWTESGGFIGIGYEGISGEELVKSLKGWGVDILVDVRLNAVSRKKGFSKRALSELLEASGITYLHMPALGNPKDNRGAYSEIDSAEGLAARATFSDRLADANATADIDRLAELATNHHVAVFCYEESELNCHRREVLSAARDRLAELVAA